MHKLVRYTIYLMSLLVILASYHQLHLFIISQAPTPMIWSSFILFIVQYAALMLLTTIIIAFIVLMIHFGIDAINESYKRSTNGSNT